MPGSRTASSEAFAFCSLALLQSAEPDVTKGLSSGNQDCEHQEQIRLFPCETRQSATALPNPAHDVLDIKSGEKQPHWRSEPFTVASTKQRPSKDRGSNFFRLVRHLIRPEGNKQLRNRLDAPNDFYSFFLFLGLSRLPHAFGYVTTEKPGEESVYTSSYSVSDNKKEVEPSRHRPWHRHRHRHQCQHQQQDW
ncbi:hypothetical protein Cob_v007303 [Colletotrichum orbiculare MAFF 240422]|uniref:Uncharacterized protein n=1 Tax=Colletotrichum orbiculare (strain 104-T / ATCC 96160 / CBS 514.97 / LARS 414 / MAFF 240422) TaxID=1213857 RepID=A0A484FQB7_COLOR|nr:hypothetical protein Cob_v007303 [Colletotrichum orbiculare MAFF 240422]